MEFFDAIYPSKGESACNSTSIQQAARHITRFYNECLAEVGLRGTQYTVLLFISRQGSIGVNALAQALVMDRTTVAHNLKPLERDGLVSVAVDTTDRRARVISLTKLGKKQVQEGQAAWVKAQRLFEAKFGEKNARQLRKTMASIVDLELALH
jgi:DNA-binding MarR family transcriptional regulator